MSNLSLSMPLRWADFDANFHLRHSVYYDFGATARLEFLSSCGLTYERMQAEHFGPVLFREEAIFRREVRPGDCVFINLLVTKMRRDFSRYSFRHELTRADGTLCAVMNVDGAWIDTNFRKLTVPPATVHAAFDSLPKAEDFEWEEK
ncbi:MAG: acyl-CoA thioesterase [Saprospiraceae bacterium]